MKLFWAGLIFGAGYVLGHPEGRARLAGLSQRPEVAHLKQQAASTVSNGAKTGQQQLAKVAHTVKNKASEKLPGKTTDGSGGATDSTGSRRGLRRPSFSRRGVRPDTSAVPAAGPVETTTGTATSGASFSPGEVNAIPVAPSTASPDPGANEAR